MELETDRDVGTTEDVVGARLFKRERLAQYRGQFRREAAIKSETFLKEINVRSCATSSGSSRHCSSCSISQINSC